MTLTKRIAIGWVATVLLGTALTGLSAAELRPKWVDGDRRTWLELHATAERKVLVPMRDGTGLATDIYTPRDAEGPFPTVFWRTPYNFNELNGPQLKFAHESVARGYAFVIQNERGKLLLRRRVGDPGLSAANRRLRRADLDQQSSPGPTARSARSAAPPPRSGRLALAATDHPAHAAMVPMAPGAGIGRVGEFWEQGNWYRGGVEQMFYLPWLYGVQNTQRADACPRALSREDVVRLSKYFDLAPEMPEVEWDKKIRTLPVADVMDEVEGPSGHVQGVLRPQAERPGLVRGRPVARRRGLRRSRRCGCSPGTTSRSTSQPGAVQPHREKRLRRRGARQPVRGRRAGRCTVRSSAPSPPRRSATARWATSTSSTMQRSSTGSTFWLKGDDNDFESETPKVQYFAMGANEWRAAESLAAGGLPSRLTCYLVERRPGQQHVR